MTTHNESTEYWKKSLADLKNTDDIVLIHVCDENRQVTKDFCCKRDILVTHMKYFESFLAENENGYDDIDISVHCDVDIFEWLMYYIHSPDNPPPFDKCLVISILISSDFLQMSSLVDLCLKFISQNLTDIIKLPIDLSCISEKLLNKLSVLTPSSVLANTIDRKDKILNKLYKRRVELDFSRKSGPRSSIAASLTCCASCHTMYLENYSCFLVCRKAEPVINFRGKPVRRHHAIHGWSLTSYLKSLHSNGLSWESIYWHVWGACTVFRINNNVVFCAAETYRYNVLENGLSINTQVFDDDEKSADAISELAPGSNGVAFSLYREDDFDAYGGSAVVMEVNQNINSMDEEACDTHALAMSNGAINKDNLLSGLNPIRKIDILPLDTFDLIKSQQRLISGEGHTATIATVCRQQAELRSTSQSRHNNSSERFDFSDALFGKKQANKGHRQGSSRELIGSESDEPVRGRSRIRSQNSKNNICLNGGNDDGSQERDTSSLRSRSMSGGPTRRTNANTNSQSGGGSTSLRKLPASATSSTNGGVKPPLSSTAPSGSLSARIGDDDDEEEEINPFATLSSIPPDVRSYCDSKLGPIDGVWLGTHPLAILPQSYHKTLRTIRNFSSKDLPPSKRNEWELDLQREYDDTRMEKYEEFLTKQRKNPEKQINKFFAKYEALNGNKKESKDSTKKKLDSRKDKNNH